MGFSIMFFVTVILIVAVILSLMGLAMTLVLRAFKAKQVRLRTNIHIIVFSSLITILAALIINLFLKGQPALIMETIVYILALNSYLKKYYQTSWTVTLAVFVVLGVVSLAIRVTAFTGILSLLFLAS